MKDLILIAIGLFLSLTTITSQVLAKKIALNIKANSLEEMVRQVEHQSGYSIIYNENVKSDSPFLYKEDDKTLRQHLKELLKDQAIGFEVNNSYIILKPSTKPKQTNKKYYTISGYVSDSQSGETLIGTNIVDLQNSMGTASNPFGFYSLTLPEGSAELSFSYLGYNSAHHSLTLNKDTVLNVPMVTNNQLEEVIVLSDRKNVGIRSTSMGAIELPMRQIKNTPVLMGETDILKTIQLLPGVQAGMEGFSGLYVRGGGPDQNLIMLDGIPVYNADHLLGVFSVFTPEAIKNVTLYKSSFPARYGGRLSSIVDIRTNDGDMRTFHGTVSIGLLTTKLHFEGPIIKDKTSFCVTARRTYVDLVAKPFMKDDKIYNYYFYDINAKVNHKFSERSRLFLSYYQGKDYYSYKRNQDYGYDNEYDKLVAVYNNRVKFDWGNRIASIRWNYLINNKLFCNTTVAFNQYRMKMQGSTKQEEHHREEDVDYLFTSDYRSGIKDWSVQTDYDFTPNPSHHIKFGGAYLFHTFRPEVMTSRIKGNFSGVTEPQDTTYATISAGNLYGHEAMIYAEDNFNIGKNLSMNLGLHASLFNTEGKSYWSLQPRLSARYALPADFSVKASYNRMAQYVHLLSSSPIALPTDLWVPITKNIKPMISDQYSAGLYYTGIKGWEISIEGYIKKMNNVLEYQEGATFFGNSAGWEEKVEMGKGRARGIEGFIQKTSGKTTGWISYTLAKSTRIFPDGTINKGLEFPYKYDRRHNLSVLATHKFSEKIDISGSWMFTTGGTATVPEQRTTINGPGSVGETDYISGRNNYRLPSSHSLNFGINFHKKMRRGTQTWNISVYNAYNNMNPNLIYTESVYVEKPSSTPEESQTYRHTKLKKYTLLPCVPSVTYTYKF